MESEKEGKIAIIKLKAQTGISNKRHSIPSRQMKQRIAQIWREERNLGKQIYEQGIYTGTTDYIPMGPITGKCVARIHYIDLNIVRRINRASGRISILIQLFHRERIRWSFFCNSLGNERQQHLSRLVQAVQPQKDVVQTTSAVFNGKDQERGLRPGKGFCAHGEIEGISGRCDLRRGFRAGEEACSNSCVPKHISRKREELFKKHPETLLQLAESLKNLCPIRKNKYIHKRQRKDYKREELPQACVCTHPTRVYFISPQLAQRQVTNS
eukprot:TRINITY_DN863_c1_g1_i1.p1 TRINITY_DN863_c1_g1~~TRINITY_DN863_c1_g1_i1.p1  ORF type:complete len:269 (+),score=-14.93 TRINITY_DN863_c1_g1_i1:226-1032(+)